jgi:hypothetical protein
MIYLKRFNEASEHEISIMNEVREFCEGYLVDMLDMGYVINIGEPTILSYKKPTRTWVPIEIKMGNDRDYNFSNLPRWEDIKDYFIPFIIMLTERYDILNGMKTILISNRNYTKDEIVEDEINIRNRSLPITQIEFTIVL